MHSVTEHAAPTVVIGRGASDAGGAASQAGETLRRLLPACSFRASAPDAPAGAEASLAAGLARGGGAPVVLLLAQAGRASHRLELPLRVDPLDGPPGAGFALLVTIPAYAAQAPQPAAALRLVEAVSRLLSLAPLGASLHEDAEAWRRGADELAARDPRVASLALRWERGQHETLPDGDEIAEGFARLLGQR
jgi:hypothetical protein